MAADRFLYIIPATSADALGEYGQEGEWFFQPHETQPYTPNGPYATEAEAIAEGKAECQAMGWEAGSYIVSVDN